MVPERPGQPPQQQTLVKVYNTEGKSLTIDEINPYTFWERMFILSKLVAATVFFIALITWSWVKRNVTYIGNVYMRVVLLLFTPWAVDKFFDTYSPIGTPEALKGSLKQGLKATQGVLYVIIAIVIIVVSLIDKGDMSKKAEKNKLLKYSIFIFDLPNKLVEAILSGIESLFQGLFLDRLQILWFKNTDATS